MKRFILFFLMWISLAFPVFAQRIPMPYNKIQFFDKNGKPLAYGKLYTYVAGTTTPKTTYTTAAGLGANTNPVILDSAGRAEVWLDSTTSYKFILKDKNDVTQWTVDSYTDWGGQFKAGTTDIGGDVTGNYDATVVSKIQGFSVSATTPTANQFLSYVSNAWTPTTLRLTATATLDFGSTDTLKSTDLTVAVTGAAVGDPVSLGLPATPDGDTCFTAWVSATNVVTVRFNNYSNGTVNPASGSYKVIVFK